MNQPLSYPLEQLMTIKKNRFDQAVKTLEQKKEILEKAYEKLYVVTQERDQTLSHKRAKLAQLREALDEGTTTDKIQQMKAYAKTVDEKLAVAEKKVVDQQKQVDIAQKQVDIATDELFQRKKDLEKLELHKQEWVKEVRYWVEQKEAVEHDEQGAQTHTLRQKENKIRKKDYE
ncbi:MAG: type III secretion T3S chaperone [Verrucomicrobia bacterium]|nr:type III secretion T3S chaperone [Verrucomicrobiota bacterium]MBU6446208.1 type III secretion T3S chaperone [Verrucomicrobiota bacterium]